MVEAGMIEDAQPAPEISPLDFDKWVTVENECFAGNIGQRCPRKLLIHTSASEETAIDDGVILQPGAKRFPSPEQRCYGVFDVSVPKSKAVVSPPYFRG